MLTRLWFAGSCLWALFFGLVLFSHGYTPEGTKGIAIVALAPFAIGLLLKLIGRYVVTGRIRQR